MCALKRRAGSKTWTTSTAMDKQSTTPIIKLIQEYCQTTPLLRLN